MAGTISKIIHFRDEEEFLDDMTEIMERFSYLASKYGHNPVEGVLLWDYIGVQDEEGVKIFRVGEFPYFEGTLKVDLETLRVMERYFDEMESKWDELRVEDIAYFVEMLNEALGREIVFYEAYDLGLDRNTAYIILNLLSIHYLEGVLDGGDRDIFEEALELLMKYI
ncbi:hypothetical protein [Thermococcus thioreducens]|uniref:Uncharacterized protein n=1 Tax=Thermococcus thioreducens TaxID=277988 RepID=A0A0Q2M4K9_9EURY|nr:hypothetical protein [Thermococcus thioreducens]ASJ12222.1 hypothetical protein A3L14_04670 [Thermococcus thioreducens]KQH82961.1 hypothetical protein AMR53_01665 [Thermococcus thioreducens]SEV94636.1 hypothetical protein SAMN05216170_1033 [Thermococcus thioreducens]